MQENINSKVLSLWQHQIPAKFNNISRVDSRAKLLLKNSLGDEMCLIKGDGLRINLQSTEQLVLLFRKYLINLVLNRKNTLSIELGWAFNTRLNALLCPQVPWTWFFRKLLPDVEFRNAVNCHHCHLEDCGSLMIEQWAFCIDLKKTLLSPSKRQALEWDCYLQVQISCKFSSVLCCAKKTLNSFPKTAYLESRNVTTASCWCSAPNPFWKCLSWVISIIQ